MRDRTQMSTNDDRWDHYLDKQFRVSRIYESWERQKSWLRAGYFTIGFGVGALAAYLSIPHV